LYVIVISIQINLLGISSSVLSAKDLSDQKLNSERVLLTISNENKLAKKYVVGVLVFSLFSMISYIVLTLLEHQKTLVYGKLFAILDIIIGIIFGLPCLVLSMFLNSRVLNGQNSKKAKFLSLILALSSILNFLVSYSPACFNAISDKGFENLKNISKFSQFVPSVFVLIFSSLLSSLLRR
jgi:amino acid permease